MTTTENPAPMTPSEIEKTVEHIIHLDAEIEHLQDQKAALQEQLTQRLPVGSYPAGAYRLTITSPPRRLNNRAIQDAYPVAQNPHLYKPTLDTKKVREHISEAVLQEQGFYQIPGNPQVRIK